MKLNMNKTTSPYTNIILLLTVCLWNMAAQAQPALKMRTFTMLDGLPSNNISMFKTAPDGMMWIATWNGLCNYDGYRFNSFVAPLDIERILISNRLRAIEPDHNGNVWLSTVGNRLYMLNHEDGRYVDYNKKFAELGIKDFEVSTISCRKSGTIWIIGTGSVNIRIQNGKHEVVPTNMHENEQCRKIISADGIDFLAGKNTLRRYGCDKSIPIRARDAYMTPQGIVIIGDKVGIYDKKTDSFKEIALPQKDWHIEDAVQLSDGTIVTISNDTVYTLRNRLFKKVCDLNTDNFYKDKKDRLWCVLEDGTIAMIDIKKGKVNRYACAMPEGWQRLTCDKSFIHEDMNGYMWTFISGKAIFYYDEDNDSFSPVEIKNANETVDKTMDIRKVGYDLQKNIWISNTSKVCILSFCNYKFRYIPLLNAKSVRSVLADHNGCYLVGNSNGNLTLLDGKGGMTGYITASGKISKTAEKFCETTVSALYEDRLNRIWVGTRGNGLFIIKENNSNGYTVTHFTKKTHNTVSDEYFCINEDIKGRLWFATKKPELMYLESNGSFKSVKNAKLQALLKSDMGIVRSISNATDGTVLFSTNNGLVTLNPHFSKPKDARLFISTYSDNETSLLSPDVMTTLPCRKSKRIYVVTMGGGLQTVSSPKLTANQLKFNYVDNMHSMTGNIQAIIEDRKGNVWIMGENIIRSINTEGKNNVYSNDDWGQTVKFSEAKPCLNSKSDEIILGAEGGVVIFNPEDIRQTSFRPPLVFNAILYQGDESATPIIGTHEIELPVNKHNATVYFSALDYNDNSNICYAYRIKELNKEWTYLGNEHFAPLSNMPSGRYTLEVRSTNNDGTWIDNNAELKIYVVPTFWQTLWAKMLYVLIAGMLLYIIVYLFKLRNDRHIEKKINERQLRFFTEISHQLRTPLTLIGGPVSELLKTEKLTDKGRNYLKFIENNANKMLTLVNKSLDLNKLRQHTEECMASSAAFSADESHTAAEQEGLTAQDKNLSAADTDTMPLNIEDTLDLTILVVEDNDELRYFLVTTLSAHYNVIEAENGKVGLRLAAEKQPDFIITDIMMEEMDGITMIRHIKADKNICHIPIIILSARTADIYRIEGLKEGADDYITKPFSVSYLQVRVESIVRQRRMLQDAWRKSLQEEIAISDTANSETTAIKSKDTEKEHETNDEANITENVAHDAGLNPIDQHFSDGFIKYVNENIANEGMKIDDIAHVLGISRSVLYGKVKSIYGITPNDIIRNIRVHRAYTMLKSDLNKNIAQVAYAVGFSDPKYFARVFKQVYGVTPTEFRKSPR